MKLRQISRVKPDTKEFQHESTLFHVVPRLPSQMKIWTLYKRSAGRIKFQTDYRIISDVAKRVPIAIQRLKAS